MLLFIVNLLGQKYIGWLPNSSLGKSEQTRAMRSRIPISNGERWAERKQYTEYVTYRKAPTFLKLNKLLHLLRSIFAKNYRLMFNTSVKLKHTDLFYMSKDTFYNHT